MRVWGEKAFSVDSMHQRTHGNDVTIIADILGRSNPGSPGNTHTRTHTGEVGGGGAVTSRCVEVRRPACERGSVRWREESNVEPVASCGLAAVPFVVSVSGNHNTSWSKCAAVWRFKRFAIGGSVSVANNC